MLSTYRDILSRPGAFAFSAAALVARLPISMVGLGIVLLVSAQTGSYGLAGRSARPTWWPTRSARWLRGGCSTCWVRPECW